MYAWLGFNQNSTTWKCIALARHSLLKIFLKLMSFKKKIPKQPTCYRQNAINWSMQIMV